MSESPWPPYLLPLFATLVRRAVEGADSDGSERCPWCYAPDPTWDAPKHRDNFKLQRHARDCEAVALLAEYDA